MCTRYHSQQAFRLCAELVILHCVLSLHYKAPQQLPTHESCLCTYSTPCCGCAAVQDEINPLTQATFPGEAIHYTALKRFHQTSFDLICKAFTFSFSKTEQPICISNALQIHVPCLSQGFKKTSSARSFISILNKFIQIGSYHFKLLLWYLCQRCLIAIVALFFIIQDQWWRKCLHPLFNSSHEKILNYEGKCCVSTSRRKMKSFQQNNNKQNNKMFYVHSYTQCTRLHCAPNAEM